MKYFTFMVGILTLVSGCTLLQNLQTSGPLDKEQFRQTILVTDDPSSQFATFSTVLASQKWQGPQRSVGDDNFLVGVIDKKTGRRSYQVHNVIYYSGAGNQVAWQLFYQVNYESPTGTQLTPLTLVKKEENCSALEVYGKCIYQEHLFFPVAEEFLRKFVSSHSNTGVWWYYLIPQKGKVYSDKFLVAEIAGLLERMEEYEIKRPFKK